MKILVQKFGGTSVSTEERREMAANKAEAALKNGYFPVIVVSAMGRTGDPYATDTLIQMAKEAGVETSPRELDLLVSCGEIISSVIMSNTMKKRGLQCAALTGAQAGIITDDNYGDAEVLRVEPKNIYNYIENKQIPIIAGFQGVTEKGDIASLGRGGSDVSAAIIGEALNAELVEIYTDVDGVMTADPRIVPDARVMNTIYYNEVFQMAEYGAKVIHPRAVEVAMRSNIPLAIKNTMNNSPGTLITNYNRNRIPKDRRSGFITAIAQIENRTQVRIYFDETASEFENDVYIFDKIASENISLDMINVFPNSRIFIIEDSQLGKLQKLLIEKNIKHEIRRNCTKVTLIGNKMRGMPGIMAKVIKAFAMCNIELLQSSDSHTTLSCLIDSKYVNTAVNALHQEFELAAKTNNVN